MEEQPLFSQRHETRRPSEGLICDDVPARVLDGLHNIFLQLNTSPDFDENGWAQALFLALDRVIPAWELDLDDVRQLVEGLRWDEFCDLCEVAWRELSQQAQDWFSNQLNALFARHYFGYELRDGRMEKVGARIQEEAIAEARGILRDPELSGPDQQYQKAIGFFNRRPEPDCEKCVEEAVLAVEGVARVLLNDESLTLSKATQRLGKEKDVHPTLVKLLENLYAYRGDAEGVGHGLTREKEVRIEEAEFVLGVSASAIVYLARLFGRGVE